MSGPKVVFEDGRWNGRTVREWLPEVVAELAAAYDPVRVVLFGSLARGEEGPDSDIDLLVVLDDVPFTHKLERAVEVRRAIRTPAPVNVWITDPDEIARRGHLTGSMLWAPLHEGVVVHERAA